MNVAVFCASSDALDEIFHHDARLLGKILAEKGWGIVYGGTNCGLMKTLADSALAEGACVKGIIPECIFRHGVAAKNLTELIIAPDMKERKHLLREAADAFVVLPGGWGTLEEITEVITLKHLGMHNKPIVFLNTAGFYDSFFNFIEEACEKSVISTAYDELYRVVSRVEEALHYIERYVPQEEISLKYK